MKSPLSPAFKRFVSDFTLGFSDGITVPFALTAGLSSLGKTDTVISGGLAELCAGSISMGIGGYLAARDEITPESCPDQPDTVDEEEVRGILSYDASSESDSVHDGEKPQARAEELVRLHLEPLNLPSSMVTSILDTLQQDPADLQRKVLRLQTYKDATSFQSPHFLPSPLICGLSISLGYAVGGTVPLFPYFFASTVGLGLQWSVGLCLLVLFAFGSGKSLILRRHASTIGGCLVEGLQMLVLGTAAAVASVVCVRLVADS
ncbi:vacuolar iron transport [Fusarium albosuccineum]|uniref:Vacuolar iron transport n=1 Tax=Fusarium albosuccineum TaxID=1237068 RepID=A0A8H4L2R9_9HYPO|nr:vacuolar iron transport [Fusarium albosuccineum]